MMAARQAREREQDQRHPDRLRNRLCCPVAWPCSPTLSVVAGMTIRVARARLAAQAFPPIALLRR